MHTMQDPPSSGTPPRRPPAPLGCDIRRNQSESPVGGARHHRGSFPSSSSSPQIAPSESMRITAREQERRFRQSPRYERQRSPVGGARHHRGSFPSSSSSPQIVPSESMRITTREQERRFRQSARHERQRSPVGRVRHHRGSVRITAREQERRSRQSARHERQRRDSDPRRMSNAQNRGRRRRPEITFVSAQPMAEHPAFADGNKGGFVPPEAPPSYEQAMRESPPVNPTFTDPAAPDHIYEVRRIYPHIINSNAIAIPSYTDSITSQVTTVTSSAISLVTSASYSSSTSSVTSQREISSSIVTSQPAPSPVRPRRNINSNNNSVEGSLQEERRRRSSDCASRSLQSSLSTSSSPTPADNPFQSRQKPALPSKRPVLRPKPRTTIQTRTVAKSNPVLNTNNSSNRRDGTNTPSPTRPVPPYNPAFTTSASDTPEGAALQPSSTASDSGITSNNPIDTRTQHPSSSITDPHSDISRVPKTTSSSNNLHGTYTGQNASCTVTTKTSSTPSVSIATNSTNFSENMSARPGNQDIMDLFGSPMSGQTQSLPAPLLPSSNTPHKPNTMSSAGDFSGFDPFSNQPQGGANKPPTANMFSAPLLPSSNLSPPDGAIASAQRPPAAVLRPTQLPVHNMTPSATPRVHISQNIAQSTGAPQPAKPPPPSLPLAPSVAQPGAILTPLPSLNRLQTGAQTNAISPTGSNKSLLSPSGNPASRKLPPPPRPPSGPKRAASMKIQSSQSHMHGSAQMTSPTKPSLPTKPTLDSASTSPTKPTQGGSNVSSLSKQQLAGNNSLLDFGLPQGDSNENLQKQTLGGSGAAPSLMDALLSPSSGSDLTPRGTEGHGPTPQTMDLFSMDLVQNGPHSSGVLAPTMNPAPVPRKNTPHTAKVPNLSDTGPNPKIEPVYAAIAKKKIIRSTSGAEGATTPTAASSQKASTPSGGESLLDMFEPSKSNMVASELEESFAPPLPASRPPLEDFEDLLSPTEMSKAMAEREAAQKTVQSPPHPAPRHATTQNTESLDDLFGFAPLGSKNGPKSSQEDNPYEFEDIFLNVEDRGLPHIAQSSPPLVLPAPRNRKKNGASGPPPLPKTQPVMPSGGTVIYNAAESPSPEATLVMQQKKPEEEKFTKKLRRQSMRIKKSAMNVFKTQKPVESESNLPEQTEKNEPGESPKIPTGKSSAAVQNKSKPPRPAGPPPPRPANLPSRSPSLMQSIQPHLISPTATHPSQNLGKAPLISPIITAPPKVPRAAPQTSVDPFSQTPTPNTTPLISFVSADPPPILYSNPIAKPKPSKPPPPKIVPTRAAPARPPPIANSNQNNHTQKSTPPPQNQTPGTPTPRPRSGSKSIPENQMLPPPMTATRPGPPTRAAPIRPPAKPLRSPPAVPPPKKGAKPASRSSKPELPPKPAQGGSSVLQSQVPVGARAPHPRPVGNVMQVPQSGPTPPQDGAKLQHNLTPPQDGVKLQDKITDVTDGPTQEMNLVAPESNLTAVAIYDFNGAADDELAFHAGDKITGVTVVTEDWCKGLLNGKCGIFPRGFVAVDTGDGNAIPVIESTPMNSLPDSFPTWDDEPEVLPESLEEIGESPEPPSSSPERVDTPSSDQFFDAKEDFHEAVALTAVSYSDTAPVNTPSAHISETTVSMTTTSQSDDVHMTTVMVRRTSIALFPFIGQDDSELTFVEGDTIEILGGVNEEWLTGELNGKQGIFPAAYVEQQPPDGATNNAGTTNPTAVVDNQDSTNTPIPTNKTDTTSPSSEEFVEPMATGIKAYTAPSSEEVSFKVGDVLYLLEQVDEEWLMVQNDRSGAVGNVPVSHVKIIHPLPEGGGSMNWTS